MRQAPGLPLEQWFERPGWIDAGPVAPNGDPRGATLVLATARDDDGARALTGRVARRLARFAEVTLIGAGDRFTPLASGDSRCDGAGPAPVATVDPASAEQLSALLRWLRERGAWPRRVVLAGRLAGDWNGVDELRAALRHELSPLLSLARALARSGDRRPVAIDVLTAGACSAGTRSADPARASVLGAVRALPLELPQMSLRQIDLDVGAALDDRGLDELSGRVVAELLADRRASVVALRGSRRLVPSLTALELDEAVGRRAFRPDGVYLITGGFGGIGGALAEHLAATERARLVLLSRTVLPPRDRWDQVDRSSKEGRAIATVVRVEALGGRVLAVAADVADPNAMRAARDALLAEYGRLDGILHAAGVPGGGLIEQREPDQIDAVLSPKTAGTVVLLETFSELEPELVVLCSSLSSFVGGVAQVDYCAANAFLDAVPESALPLAGRTLAVNWGGMLGSGMWVPRDGDVGMRPPDAIRALRRAVGAGIAPRVVIAPVHVSDARPWLPTRADIDAGADPLEIRLGRIWATILDRGSVAADDDFFALGGDSLRAVELLWAIADEIGFRLPMQLLIENPTPAAAAQAIARRADGSSPAARARR